MAKLRLSEKIEARRETRGISRYRGKIFSRFLRIVFRQMEPAAKEKAVIVVGVRLENFVDVLLRLLAVVFKEVDFDQALLGDDRIRLLL